MTSGIISLTSLKLQNKEECLVNPRWLEDTHSTPSSKFSIKPDLQNVLSQFNSKANCLPKVVRAMIVICDRVEFMLLKTVFKKYFLQCAPLLPIVSFHGIFRWKLLSKTTLVEGRKQKWTIILTQIPFSYYCLVFIKLFPVDISLKIYF